jgi:hypothetical protein
MCRKHRYFQRYTSQALAHARPQRSALTDLAVDIERSLKNDYSIDACSRDQQLVF